MADKRVVITGLGVLSSCGIGKEAFWEAIFSGSSGIKPISLFDTQPFKAKSAGEIKDFKPQDFLGVKGLRTLDRSTKLAASATYLALEDTKLKISEENTRDIGVAIGTTLGSVNSISEFDKEAIKEGPHYVNPALFSNTVINSPASQVSIKFNIKGFNATISTGFSAGLDAINYAADFLRLSRAKIVLAGAVEELCIQTFLGFYKTGLLAGTNDALPEISCPFDKRRNGFILGEGSAILVLEDLESALARQAKIYAEVSGFGMGFGRNSLKKAMRLSLEEAKVSADNIDYICAGANSSVDSDLIEAEAIKDVFGNLADKVSVSSIKSVTGECFSASGSLQVAASVGAIEKQMIPPTINYEQKDPECNLNHITNKAQERKVEKVLINAFAPSGVNSSLIISRFN